MNDRLLIGTRKGLFDIRRTRGTWTIAATRFLGDPISMLLTDPRDGTCYAAQALGHFGVKLQRSRDDGETWQEIPAPAFPKDTPDGPSVSYIFCLETGGAEQPGWIWCGTIPGALFLSRDHGETWSLNEPLWNVPERKEWMGGGFDQAGVASICVDPRNAGHITVGVSTGGVWITDDGGKSWRASVDGMYAEYAPPQLRHAPQMQDVHRLVQCPSAPDTMWAQHHNGVFRSTDGARSWQDVTTIRPAKFGFAVVAHPSDPDTAWFVPGVKDECRSPGRCQPGSGAHPRRRAFVRCTDEWAATEPRVRSDLPPRAGDRRQRHAPRHGFHDRPSVDIAKRRRQLDAGRRLPAASCLRAVLLGARHGSIGGIPGPDAAHFASHRCA